MGESADRIEERIRAQRDELHQNLGDLQSKAAHAVDWRARFNERPLVMVGLAFGGGVLLSALGGRRRPSSPATAAWRDDTHRPAAGRGGAPRSSRHTWKRLRGALLGVAATRLGAAVEAWLPGFQQGYDSPDGPRGRAG